MATRSRIGYLENGFINSIYCHFDGHINGVGNILFKSYNTLEKIKELISYGDASSLGNDVSKCTFYHRDREEDINIGSCDISEYPKFFEEFNYLFKDNNWYLMGRGYANGKLLSELMEDR